MPPVPAYQMKQNQPTPPLRKEEVATSKSSKAGVPQRQGTVTGNLNTPGEESGRSEPSTTITAPIRSASAEAANARAEFDRITATCSRMMAIYNIAPYGKYHIFSGVITASEADTINRKIMDVSDAVRKMNAIVSGDVATIDSVRKEYEDIYGLNNIPVKKQSPGEAPQQKAEDDSKPAEVPSETKKKPAEVKSGKKNKPTEEPSEEKSAEDTVTPDDSIELVDYLRKRYFWQAENEIYNSSRDMYVRRNVWVDSILASRSNFEADEDDSWIGSFAKWASTFNTRDEALSYINKIQGMYMPQVPHHIAGEENRHLLLPDANKQLDALERSRLSDIQEAYIKVHDNVESAISTGEVLLKVAEATKMASEIVISTGATIVTGGNPAAEALINGLYSGALSVAEQASASSIGESEFKKSKARLDASGLDPESEEYKQALAALESKREASEISWKKVALDATVSASLAAAPGLGKWAKNTKLGRTVAVKAGKVVDWVKGSPLGKGARFVKNKISSVKDSVVQFGKRIGKAGLEKTGGFIKGIGSKFAGWGKKGWNWFADTGFGKKVINLAKKFGGGIKSVASFILGKGKSWLNKAGSVISGGAKTFASFVKGLLKRASDTSGGKLLKSLIDKVPRKTYIRYTAFGNKFSSLYHRAFDRFSMKNLAGKQLDDSMRSLLPGFDRSQVALDSFLDLEDKTGVARRIAIDGALPQITRATEKAQVAAFESGLSKSLSSDVQRAYLGLFHAATNPADDVARIDAMRQALKVYNEALEKASKSGVESVAESMLPKGMTVDMLQEEMLRSLKNNPGGAGLLSESEAFVNSVVLNSASTMNEKVAIYLAQRDFFNEVADQQLKYKLMSGAESGIMQYGGELLDPLVEKGKDALKDKLDETSKEKIGLSVSNPIGISAPNPLDALKDVLEEGAKNKAQGLGHSLDAELFDAPEDYDFLKKYRDQYLADDETFDYTALGKVYNMFSEKDDSSAAADDTEESSPETEAPVETLSERESADAQQMDEDTSGEPEIEEDIDDEDDYPMEEEEETEAPATIDANEILNYAINE